LNTCKKTLLCFFQSFVLPLFADILFSKGGPRAVECRMNVLTEVMALPKENKVLRVGDKAPDFSLRDASTGEMVSLDDLLGQPLMIAFGRGTW
jgi:hypothetical protein